VSRCRVRPSRFKHIFCIGILTDFGEYRAKEWLESHITTIPTPFSPSIASNGTTMTFEQSLRDGYYLAHLARSLGGNRGGIFNHPDLQLKHTDNIMQFFGFVQSVGLPEVSTIFDVFSFDGNVKKD
jgi:Ras GTPase-activating-like protein IQGAP2/3